MKDVYDVIVIGSGSAGLSVSLFMGKVGLKTLLIERAESQIGGDCLNHGCVPSKALIHISKILNSAKAAEAFGYTVSGTPDKEKIAAYIEDKQLVIRQHENSSYLRSQHIDVVLGEASFHSRNSIIVNQTEYTGKKIVIATGSRPMLPQVKGIEKVTLFDNESIFDITKLPQHILVLGAGPVGIEIAQALNRLGSNVTVVGRNKNILPHDPVEITTILKQKLEEEGISIYTGSEVKEFLSNQNCRLEKASGEEFEINFDAVFSAVGRKVEVEQLNPAKEGIKTADNAFVVNEYLCTTNPNVFVCGDVAGSLKFSHAAEQHARILLNNFFSPLKQKLDNSKMSWVTFTDPQVGTFGLNEIELTRRKISFKKIIYEFKEDDRAVVDDYQYGKLILFISSKHLLHKPKILGGSMIAPQAGEMIQELILAQYGRLNIHAIFNKIYPYPVASRVNQLAIVKFKEKSITAAAKKLLRLLFKIFS